MSMQHNLNEQGAKLLDGFLTSTLLNEAKSIKIALRNFISERKDSISGELGLNERDFRAFHAQTTDNILNFLLENEFLSEREGGVLFITEKGKNLRKQGSLEKYAVWQKDTRAKNKVVIHTIETRGYLDQDEIVRNRRALIMKRIKKFVVYPLLLILLLVVLVAGAHKYGYDKKVPFIHNLFKGEKVKNSNKSGDNNHKHNR
jgi:hypothetical protein